MSIELGVAAAMRHDWSRVGYYATVGFRRFIATWSGLHPCALAARTEALKKLQRLLLKEPLHLQLKKLQHLLKKLHHLNKLGD